MLYSEGASAEDETLLSRQHAGQTGSPCSHGVTADRLLSGCSVFGLWAGRGS